MANRARNDLEGIRRSLPFKVIETNIPGVWSLPPLPEGFDPDTASDIELLKNGIFIPRPKPGDDPALAIPWERALSIRRSLVVPKNLKVVSRPRRTRTTDVAKKPAAVLPPIVPPPVVPPGHPLNPVSTNPFWSGCFAEGKWGMVSADWVVPAVTAGLPVESGGEKEGGGTTTFMSASWVGLDGSPPNPNQQVLQVGVAQNYPSEQPGDQGEYAAFFEWDVPGDETPYYILPVFLNDIPVSAGDTVSGTVMYITGQDSVGYVAFSNLSATSAINKSFAIVLPAPQNADLSGGSIEWIMECPGGIGGTTISGQPANGPGTSEVSLARTGSGIGAGPPGSTIGTGVPSGQFTGMPQFTQLVFSNAVGSGVGVVGDPYDGQILNLVGTIGTLEQTEYVFTNVGVGHNTVTVNYAPTPQEPKQ